MTVDEDRIAVQAWSLDRTFGQFRLGADSIPDGALDPLDLPAALRAHGFDRVQVCHFQLGSRDPGYLADLRGAFTDARVTLDALLIDDGDLTHPTDGPEHEAWVGAWIDDAARLGALTARAIAGKTRTDDAIATASAALGRLSDRADDGGVQLLTENWFDVTASADDVFGILEPLDGRVGLVLDLANWRGDDKYDELARIAPFGVSSHSKANWDGDVRDDEDYLRSVAAVEDAGFRGPHALVYAGPSDDEWAGLDDLRDVLRTAITQPAR
jgi:sugar phosphate isomerase/epimerase